MKSNNLKKQSAEALTKVSMNIAAKWAGCCYIFHQPKMPELLKQIKKH